jgi:YfiH family protein
LTLAILVADCVPVLVADVRRRVVGAFHAGWRGTAAGIVEVGIGKMVEELGARSEDMVAAIGPSIGPCCYEVGDEVREAFGRFGEGLFRGRNVDLWEANRRQLVGAGLSPERVTVMGECSACARENGKRKYFSHRAECGFTGRMMGAILIAEGGQG